MRQPRNPGALCRTVFRMQGRELRQTSVGLRDHLQVQRRIQTASHTPVGVYGQSKRDRLSLRQVRTQLRGDLAGPNIVANTRSSSPFTEASPTTPTSATAKVSGASTARTAKNFREMVRRTGKRELPSSYRHNPAAA